MCNMKKVYISLPIGGFEDTVVIRHDAAVKHLMDMFDGNIEIVSPVDIDKFDCHGRTEEPDHDWAWYMGQDIEMLLRCDYIYMCAGYLNSPGCRCELAVARERDLKVLYAPDACRYLKSD